ncbi:MAG: zinc-binding alcohol dehydrogenase family protein [Acidovorax sp.]|uniref:zinc-binding alcohol dehydrogenase family protein n=1 Tax=Acidovorax sp. TaxID=1872122 RepID=UPI0039E300CA
MKAVGYRAPHPIDHPDALRDITLPDPSPTGRDLLVAVHAVSVNPVDAKVRASSGPAEGQDDKVLGWDACGTVRAVGPEATLFRPGDRVWYAGSIARPGTNSELHVVDERIVGHAPKSLDNAQAAALPLTAITAWELLFDRLDAVQGSQPTGRSLLIIGAGGGVGSILTQLAARLTGLTVIATASRPETRDWVHSLGAHHVIDHGQPLAAELARIGHPTVDLIASLTQTDAHFGQIVQAIAPQGRLGLIDDPVALDATLLKRKSVSLHWELMFTRALFGTDDMVGQHHLLNEVARLVDAGVLRTTLSQRLGAINAANLKRAHALVESGRARGKLVLEGWG